MLADEGRPGASFLIIHRFMWAALGLSGVTLHVYARIYGFCRDGTGHFYESRAATARFLGTTSRTVSRSIAELLACGLIHEDGEHQNANGSATRNYVIDRAAVRLAIAEERGVQGPVPGGSACAARGGMAPPDGTSGGGALNPDGTSGSPVTGCHPIRKSERKGQ